MVEALTIVLASGLTRGWRSSLTGVRAATLARARVAAALGRARVPENTMKFAVGVMLTTFGIFWGAEGAGVSWPGSDAAILGVLAYVVLLSVAMVGLLRRRRPGSVVAA